jgi:GNAT superfamily N-acetyltransferase
MAQDSIEYSATDISEIRLIQPLWEQLNRHHHAGARAFREIYNRWTFGDRVAYFTKVAAAGPFRVDLARDPLTDRFVGYCISSVSPEGFGEIESVFVEPAYRSHGIGTTLMNNTLAWLNKHNPGRIRVAVADGNEDAFPFYRKFGFFPRMTVLERKTD